MSFENNTHRPVQILHSFEGLINGVDLVEVSAWGRGGRDSLDCSNFEPRVSAELEKLVDRGIGGVVVNVDYAGYLEDEAAWGRFITGLEIAVGLGLRIWLYDEKGHPSGYAGGLTLRDHPELEARGMRRLRIDNPTVPFSIELPDADANLYALVGMDKSGETVNLPATRGSHTASVAKGEYRHLDVFFEAPLGGGIFMYPEYVQCKRYLNVLDSRAIDRFLSVTHLRYHKKIPAHLWEHVEAIFSDEMFIASRHVVASDTLPTLNVPWCDEIESAFLKCTGYPLAETVGSLFEGDSPEERKTRRIYRRCIAELYERSMSRIGTVCSALKIDLTGHLLGAKDLYGNAIGQGNHLRTIATYQRPGLDFLTSKPEKLLQQVFESKMLASAGLFAGRQSLMVEVSEYGEYWAPRPERQELVEACQPYWTGDREANTIEEIKHTIAFLFLIGVRDFAYYYPWRHFSVEEYREMTDFTARLVEHGRGSRYQPDCALFYPVEFFWEEYLPTDKHWYGEGYKLQSPRLKDANEMMSDLCRKLFLDNIQYILCDRSNLHRLVDLKIDQLLLPPIGEPGPEVVEFCSRNGIQLVHLDSSCSQAAQPQSPHEDAPIMPPEGKIVYGRYDRFCVCLNLSREPDSVTVERPARYLLPCQGSEIRSGSGRIELAPLESVIIFGGRAK